MSKQAALGMIPSRFFIGNHSKMLGWTRHVALGGRFKDPRFRWHDWLGRQRLLVSPLCKNRPSTGQLDVSIVLCNAPLDELPASSAGP